MNIFENLENLNISENCFNEIMDIVEAVINERNKGNREKKKEWEMKRGGYPETPTNPTDSKEKYIKQGENVIKALKRHDKYVEPKSIEHVSQGIRAVLGRQQNPVSYRDPSEFDKTYSTEKRTVQSQRGSSKDPYEVSKHTPEVSTKRLIDYKKRGEPYADAFIKGRLGELHRMKSDR